MSRGRKPTSNFNSSEWETVFYNSVGTYVQYINIQLSKEYELEPLANHLKIVGGYAFKTAEYKNQGIPIIRISDFNSEQIVLKDVVYYQESKELDKYQLVEGDIIIALTGGTIAKLAIVQPGLGKIYLNQRVGKFQTLKPDEFEIEYIYWLARSIQSIIKNLAWGAAIPNVSPKQIEELKFPFPTKEIQRGIIDFLNDLKNNNLKEDKIYFDEIIENEIVLLQEKQLTTSTISSELTHQLTLVKKLRQQILQDAVQGKLVEQNKKDEPASELLNKIKAEKQKLIAEKKLKKEKELPPIKPEEIPFEIPENWVWCRLGEITLDVSYGTSQKAEITGEVPVLRMGNITSDGEVLYSNLKYVSSKISDLPKLYLKNGDLIFNRTNSYELVGKSGVFENVEPFTLASYLIRVRFFSLIQSKFIANYINSKVCRTTQLEPQIIQQNGQANFNGTKLSNILIPLPSLSEQTRIVQKLDELMQYCNELEASIKESQMQNEKLLQQVLREALRKEPVGV
jgi:type I restriction enzyme S subunit